MAETKRAARLRKVIERLALEHDQLSQRSFETPWWNLFERLRLHIQMNSLLDQISYADTQLTIELANS